MYQTETEKFVEYNKKRNALLSYMPKTASAYLVREIELLKLENAYYRDTIECMVEADRKRSK